MMLSSALSSDRKMEMLSALVSKIKLSYWRKVSATSLDDTNTLNVNVYPVYSPYPPRFQIFPSPAWDELRTLRVGPRKLADPFYAHFHLSTPSLHISKYFTAMKASSYKSG
eukprot:6176040-Pleurochrysis_carterae.AAC.1